MRRGALLPIALLVSGLAISPAGRSLDRSGGGEALPRLMLWAWERPTDLRDLDAHAGVAFLSQTLVVRNDAVRVVPRRSPLRVSPATALVAVTRIEIGEGGGRALGEPAVATMADAIARTMALPRVRGVQIDFDAAESERAFYRALVVAVRKTLGPDVPLSITALASWCAEDRWLNGLPVDEAVPMLFRMGPAAAVLRAQWGIGTVAPKCRTSRGVSLDEAAPRRGGSGRTYVFNPGPWNAAAIRAAVEEDR